MTLLLQVAVPLALLALATVAIVWFTRRRAAKPVDLVVAREVFHRRREWLEARFLTAAARQGKPRGLRWADCDFDDGLSLARDRTNGVLRGLVGCTIRFEAIEGGGMEDNPNVGNLRTATAVFTYENQAWSTDGRALFNLSPSQAIERLGRELETVE